MRNNLLLRVVFDCLKRGRLFLIFYLIVVSANLGIFYLYSLKPEPFLYALLVSLFFCLAGFVVLVWKQYLKAKKLEFCLNLDNIQPNMLELPNTLEEDIYQSAIKQICMQNELLLNEYENDRRDMADYYVTWVHQIKTPIAVMKMRLGTEDTEESRLLSSELFRIEQYVDMVLQYVRLDSRSTDLRIEEYQLDSLVREAIRKYASQFIIKGLGVSFEPTNTTIVTDKKLFLNIVEQLLSNAIKYTRSGKITISYESGRLKISDTGIGIAKEDLKRIFEKGFTGLNGRMGEKSSGIGLYLCKRSADMLNLKIYAESELGKGSTFVVEFPKN